MLSNFLRATKPSSASSDHSLANDNPIKEGEGNVQAPKDAELFFDTSQDVVDDATNVAMTVSEPPVEGVEPHSMTLGTESVMDADWAFEPTLDEDGSNRESRSQEANSHSTDTSQQTLGMESLIGCGELGEDLTVPMRLETSSGGFELDTDAPYRDSNDLLRNTDDAISNATLQEVAMPNDSVNVHYSPNPQTSAPVPTCDPSLVAAVESLPGPQPDFTQTRSREEFLEAQGVQSSIYANILPDGEVNVLDTPMSSIAPAQAIRSDVVRSKSVPPKCSSHYAPIANWPPPEPPACDLGTRKDAFPPKNAPLHVWIQAYALRWGVWAASIQDGDRRKEVLDWMGDKMKQAWETAIKEGYYTRPSGMILDTTHTRAGGDNSDGQNKRSRKRAQSLSKTPAPFAYEGTDKFAITYGELRDHGITMDMVLKRVENRNYDAGDVRFDEVLSALPNDRELQISDWSVTPFGSVPKRNLLVYSLFAVQEARKEIQKLENLKKGFKKDVQIQNTRRRIDLFYDRVAQHLALAAILSEREPYIVDASDKGGSEAVDSSHKDDVPSVDSGEGHQVATHHTDQTPRNAQEILVDLTQAILSAKTEKDLYLAFTTRHLNPHDLASLPHHNGKSKVETALPILQTIYEGIENLLSFRTAIRSQQVPSEKIKMGHDARLQKGKIEIARQRLKNIFEDDLKVTHICPIQSADEHLVVSNEQPTSQTIHLKAYQDGQDFTDTPYHVSTTRDRGATPEANQETSSSEKSIPVQEATVGQGLPEMDKGRIEAAYVANNSAGQSIPSRPPASTPSSTIQQPHFAESGPPMILPEQQQEDLALKQAYIEEQWLPFLKKVLIDVGLSPIQHKITSWTQIKDVFERLGFTSGERNEQLRRFKMGYERYCQQHAAGWGTTISSSAGLNLPSPRPPANNLVTGSAPPSWPSDSEILAAIPPQGIPAAKLMQIFGSRVNQYQQQFGHTLTRLANVDMSYNVFPKQKTQFESKKYNTRPPEPPQRVSVWSPKATVRDSTQSNLIKLKLGPRPQVNEPPISYDAESDMPEDLRSNLVNGSRGFSFRHLSHATLEQRQRMDEEVGEYISKTTKSRKKNYYGTYVTFRDPDDPTGPIIVHGFWELKDGSRPEGSDWFYNGEDVPENWDTELGGLVEGGNAGDEQTQPAEEVSRPSRPRIKLRVGGQAQVQPYAHAAGMMNSPGRPSWHHNNSQEDCNPVPVPEFPRMTTDEADHIFTNFTPGVGSINPAQLMLNYQKPGSAQMYGQAGTQRLAKRSVSGNRDGGRKKQKQRHEADMDDSGDYDPNQDV